ncbi:MAG: CBS domain-containing protein, partial [Gammaproteobacteria bacterium]|nr:CBS domain-containing protein [Gammaproteobacteria bacterium]
MKTLGHLERYLTRPDTIVRAVLELFSSAEHQFCLVVDGERRLLGAVTDGDIRRAILLGIALDDPVRRCMNRQPTVGRVHCATENAKLLKG